MISILLEGQLMWDIPFLMILTCIAVLYAFLVKSFTNSMFYFHKQTLFFFIGLGLLYLTIGSPLTVISHLSFSLHMIQMSMLYFIIPPIILLGIHDSFFSSLRKVTSNPKQGKLLLSPVIALSIFAALFLVYHLPATLYFLSENSFLHNGFTLMLFVLSIIMWWPIVAPDPKQRLCNEKKKQYAFLSGLILMPACLLFIVSAFIDGVNNPFLTQLTADLCLPASSNSLAILPPPFNTKIDQVMAGFFMMAMHKFALMLTYRIGLGTAETSISKRS